MEGTTLSDGPKVLTVAGSDSGGGAGIQADLKTFTALGVFGGSVVTALTAQNTIGVQGIHAPDAEFVSLQLESVLSDMNFKVVKTGMLPSIEILKVCAKAFRKYKITNLIVDPVMVATSGDTLAGGKEWIEIFKQYLIPLALIVTPNLAEASRLIGRPIRSERDIRVACSEILNMGCKNVIIKGGHTLERNPVDLSENLDSTAAATDILFDGKNYHAFSKPRLDSTNTHGTGCTLASAIAAEIAKGATVPAAVATAKTYVFHAIRTGFCIGNGRGVLNHMHGIKEDRRKS